MIRPLRLKVTLRYPMGGTEFRLSDNAPATGDVMVRRGGRAWVARTIATRPDGSLFVTLAPLEEPDAVDRPAPSVVRAEARRRLYRARV